jgi:hypothetical protein
MKLSETIKGKTLVGATYEEHSTIALMFSDGSLLLIRQPMQAGALDTYYLDDAISYKVQADDAESEGTDDVGV